MMAMKSLLFLDLSILHRITSRSAAMLNLRFVSSIGKNGRTSVYVLTKLAFQGLGLPCWYIICTCALLIFHHTTDSSTSSRAHYRADCENNFKNFLNLHIFLTLYF